MKQVLQNNKLYQEMLWTATFKTTGKHQKAIFTDQLMDSHYAITAKNLVTNDKTVLLKLLIEKMD